MIILYQEESLTFKNHSFFMKKRRITIQRDLFKIQMTGTSAPQPSPFPLTKLQNKTMAESRLLLAGSA